MKRLQITEYRLKVTVNDQYQFIVESPRSAITERSDLPEGLYQGIDDVNSKCGVMQVHGNRPLVWFGGDGTTAVTIKTVVSEIIK